MRCAKPEKQVELIGKYMAQQDKWVSQEVRPDPIFDVAKQVGMTRAEFDACRQNQSIIEALKAIKERGRKLGIIGTPNFFVMEKRVKSTLTMADIRAMVDPLLQQGARPAATASARFAPGSSPLDAVSRITVLLDVIPAQAGIHASICWLDVKDSRALPRVRRRIAAAAPRRDDTWCTAQQRIRVSCVIGSHRRGLDLTLRAEARPRSSSARSDET